MEKGKYRQSVPPASCNFFRRLLMCFLSERSVQVCFHIESEVGIGTTIQIRMPIDALDDRIQMHR